MADLIWERMSLWKYLVIMGVRATGRYSLRQFTVPFFWTGMMVADSVWTSCFPHVDATWGGSDLMLVQLNGVDLPWLCRMCVSSIWWPKWGGLAVYGLWSWWLCSCPSSWSEYLSPATCFWSCCCWSAPLCAACTCTCPHWCLSSGVTFSCQEVYIFVEFWQDRLKVGRFNVPCHLN